MPQDGRGGTLSFFKVLTVGLYYVNVLPGVLVRIVGSSLRSLFPLQDAPATPRDRSEHQHPVSAKPTRLILSVHRVCPKTCRSDTPIPLPISGGYPCCVDNYTYHAVHSTPPPLPSHSTGVCCQQAGASAIDISGNPTETSVLVEAARSGSGEMIDAVATTMSDLLTEKRVCVLLCPDGVFTMI